MLWFINIIIYIFLKFMRNGKLRASLIDLKIIPIRCGKLIKGKLTHLKIIHIRLLSVWEGVHVPKMSFLIAENLKKKKRNIYFLNNKI